MGEANFEDLVSDLMIFVSLETNSFPTPKRLAVERYMRTVLRSFTRYELEFALSFYRTNGFLDPDLTFKINQASKGYDRFMSSRGRAEI